MRPIPGRHGERPQLQTLARYGLDEELGPGGADAVPAATFAMDNTFAQGGGRAASLGPGPHKPFVRLGHEAFLDRASDAIASSVAESTQLLREVGPLLGTAAPSSASAARRAGRGGAAASRSLTPPRPLLVAPPPPPVPATVASAAPVAAEPLPPQHLPERAFSARDLFAAMAADDRGGEGGGPRALPPPVAVVVAGGAAAAAAASAPPSRAITVHDFQRGAPLVAPAPPLPFPGPDGQSPGRRRRAAALAVSASSGSKLAEAVVAPSGFQPLAATATLADGITTMLTGARCDLGEILTAPVDPGSSFDSLLDRLVEDPVGCFAEPRALWHGATLRAGRRTGSPEGQLYSFDA